MLPQPRNGVTATTRSLIPNVLTKKPPTPSVAKKHSTPTATKSKVNPTPLINDYSDDSDIEEVENDFFSMNKPIEIPTDVEMPLDVEPNTTISTTNTNTQKPRGIEAFFKKEEVNHTELEPEYDNSIVDQPEAGSSYNGYGSENSNSNEVLLDDEAVSISFGHFVNSTFLTETMAIKFWSGTEYRKTPKATRPVVVDKPGENSPAMAIFWQR